MNTIVVNKRDRAIDLVKFFATLLVLNSHMEICYPKYSFLATGGAIGDSLFFFASGLALSISTPPYLLIYINKRIGRLFPVLLAAAIVGLLFGIDKSFSNFIIAGDYWFVQCIFLYYIVVYPMLKCRDKSRFLIISLITAISYFVFYFLFFDITKYGMIYGINYYRWGLFFLILLQGVYIKRFISKSGSWVNVIYLLLCVATYYAILYSLKSSLLQIVSLVPLMGVNYNLYKIGNINSIEKIINTSKVGKIALFIGALCFECYLVQKFIISEVWNNLFPLNLLLIVGLVLLLSYATHHLAVILSCVLRNELITKEKFKIIK